MENDRSLIWYAIGAAGLIVIAHLMNLLGVFIFDHMGKPEGYRNPRWTNTLCIPAFAIMIGIFTNDLHQLAFHFPEGIELFDYEYGYGLIYFAAMV